MIDINLKQIANQELTIALEDSRYEIAVIETNVSMAITITKDSVVLVQNARLIADAFLLRDYLVDADSGNFMLTSQDESLPAWQNFGITQFLVYITSDELLAL